MAKAAASHLLPYELLAFLRTPLTRKLISTRALQIWYLKTARLISKRSQRYLITGIPAVQRQLRWAVLLALLRTYILFMRRIILDPRSGFEKTLNKHGAWMLFMAVREKLKARVRKGVEGGSGGNGGGGQQDFVTPPTSPMGMSVPDYFLRSPEIDPILLAVRQIIPDATGYKVVLPQSSTVPNLNESRTGSEAAKDELTKRITGRNVETKAYYKDGIVKTPTTSENGKHKIVSLVIMEDMGDRKSFKGAVTVDTNVGNIVETNKIEELGVSFAEALAY